MSPTPHSSLVHLQQTIYDLQRQLAELTAERDKFKAERDETLAQQAANTEVLGVINSSPGDLAPVFDAILDKGLQLCEAAFGTLWTFDGECFHAAVLRRVPAGFAKVLTQAPYRPETGSGHELLLRGAPYVQVDDVAAEAIIGPVRRALIEFGGARTILAVPLLKNGAVLGAISAYRQEVRQFSEKQIALLQNFAGGHRDGKCAAVDRDARSAGTADCDRRGIASHQFLARRPRAGVRRNTGKGPRPMRCLYRQFATL